MDLAELRDLIEACEAVRLDGPQYLGLTLGELFRTWRDEVESGRLATASRGKSSATKVAKAYTKLAVSIVNLKDAMRDLPPGSMAPRNLRGSSSRSASQPAASSQHRSVPTVQAVVPWEAPERPVAGPPRRPEPTPAPPPTAPMHDQFTDFANQ